MRKELEANTTLSHYRIVSKIGEGGMGEVYRAQDTSELGRTVALKMLSAEVAKDKNRLQRFTQEARTVSNLNHPNILTVYEFGQADSLSFIATEYVEGVTLREYLSGRRLKLIDVLDVVIQIVAALNAAHEAGVTHRDLKPENVMVRKDHIIKVLDFGLAKLSEPPAVASGPVSEASEDATKVLVKTEPGLVMGTVSYMSPEQSVGSVVDTRTDIWSTGVVLYEMIVGSIPFPGKDMHRQIIAIQETDPLPLAQQVEGVPERLEEIVLKCLAKEKDERYQSAKDLLIDLRNLRRKLDVDAEIERTVAPNLRTTSASQTGAPRTQSAAAVTLVQQPNPTSSAEYIVTRVKQHKLVSVMLALVFVSGTIGLVMLWRARANNAINSIAVLPFQNRSTDADTDYLSDGLAESLIYRLSQLPNLKVSPTSSVFRYKGKDTDAQKIGNELGVSAVMTGRIVKRGDNLTISVELVDVRNNKLLWGEQYERKMSELLTTQREIAGEIANKLQVKLSGEGEQKLAKNYTDSNEAYQLYLKGLFHFANRTKADVYKAIDYYQQATRLDPNFALAYVGISQAYSLMPSYSYLTPKEALPQAKAAAQKALEIDPSLADAHAALATALVNDWNWPEAEREFKRAIELNPNVAEIHYRYGLLYLLPVGRMDEAIREIKRALELEPLSIAMNANLAGAYLYARQNDLALAQARKTFDLEPGHITARIWLLNIYENLGMYSEAIALNEEFLKSQPSEQGFLLYAGYAYAKTGRRDKAEDVVRKLRDLEKTEVVDPYTFAVLYVGMGDKDKAFVELEKNFNERGFYILFMRFDPFMDPLHDDPRFADLIKRIGFPK